MDDKQKSDLVFHIIWMLIGVAGIASMGYIYYYFSMKAESRYEKRDKELFGKLAN